jgi:hypothetical protein
MLTALDIELIRTPVEEVDLDLFAKLEPGDILFIDASISVQSIDSLCEVGCR